MLYTQPSTLNLSDLEAILQRIEVPSQKVLEKGRIQLVIRTRQRSERVFAPSRQLNESYNGGDIDRLWTGGRGIVPDGLKRAAGGGNGDGDDGQNPDGGDDDGGGGDETSRRGERDHGLDYSSAWPKQIGHLVRSWLGH